MTSCKSVSCSRRTLHHGESKYVSVACLSVRMALQVSRVQGFHVPRKLKVVISVVKKRGIFNFQNPGNGEALPLPHIFTRHTAARRSRRLSHIFTRHTAARRSRRLYTRINKVTLHNLGLLIFINAEFCQKFLHFSI